jgi:competence protein ComEA
MLAAGVLIGLLASGVILLASDQPRGGAIELQPPPTPGPVLVHVGGAVLQAGVFSLPRGSRVYQAIEAAGGLAPDADAQAINQAALLEDGMALFIPAVNQDSSESLQSDRIPPALRSIPSALVNINTASDEELEALPEIGPELARRIIAYRSENGPFLSIEAIQDVAGIGPAIFERIQDLITVGNAP